MPLYKYPSTMIGALGCRIEPAGSWQPKAGELAMPASPVVDLPRGSMLVGPSNSKLMRMHALLMSAAVPSASDAGQDDLTDTDVFDLVEGMIENCGYETLIIPMSAQSRPGPRLSKQQAHEYAAELMRDVAERTGTKVRDSGSDSERDLWGSLLSIVRDYGVEPVRSAATQGKVYLSRFLVSKGPEAASEPMLPWEMPTSQVHSHVVGWKLPPATVLRMIDTIMFNERAAEAVNEYRAETFAVGYPRQRAS